MRKRMAFFGRVLPERANVEMSPVVFKSKNGKPFFRASVSIVRSQVHVDCEWDKDVGNVLTVRNELESQVRAALDTVGFTLRAGYDLEMVSALNLETGGQIVFGVDEQIDISSDFPDIAAMVLLAARDNPLRMALASFREAIRTPHDTSLFCYRAIESIRQAFLTDKEDTDTPRTASWQTMRGALNLAEETVREPEPLAKSLRHGEDAPQPAETRKRHMEIAHEIIRRYFWFRQGGGERLDANKYVLF